MRDIPMHYFWMSLLVMAGVTYLIRAVPFTLCRKKVENRFVKSFLAYVPYAVLGAMTFPAIIYSADKIAAGVAGVDNYVVLYIPDSNKKVVTILRVMYAGRDIDNQLNLHTKQ